VKRFVIIMFIVSLAIAGVVSWFASTHSDGLEQVAKDHGFIGKAREPLFSVLPDYTVPGLSGFVSNGAAGVIGVLATFGLVMLVGKVLAAKRRRR